MGKLPDERRSARETPPDDTNTVFAVFATMADTTWRMFVPPGLGAVVGLQLEHQGIESAAVWGAILGIVVSGVLVWLQYRAVHRDSE